MHIFYRKTCEDLILANYLIHVTKVNYSIFMTYWSAKLTTEEELLRESLLYCICQILLTLGTEVVPNF
jgi:hypothetical protein